MTNGAMDLDKLKNDIRLLNPADQIELRSWLDEQEKDNDYSRATLTEDELEVLTLVRLREVDGEATSPEDLAKKLGKQRTAVTATINRLNDKAFGPYLKSNRTSTNQTFYSTIYNKIVRQPATAMMALLFEYRPNLQAANRSDLEKFGAERDISNVSYCLDYLMDLRYFVPRGDGFGPGRRLHAEKHYLRDLANRWALQSVEDRTEVERCRNEILWRVWELERKADPNKSNEATQAALVEHVANLSVHVKARQLAEHSVDALISEGALKERIDLDVGPVYFLNERDDPGHCVVTWPGTALILRALADNVVRQQKLHMLRIEEVYSYCLSQGLLLEEIRQALEFSEHAKYVELYREEGRIARVWRKERLLSQITYIRRLADVYGG